MIARQDIDIYEKGWGLRIQLKTESPTSQPIGPPTIIRKKQRVSFNPKNEFSFDLTTVRSGRTLEEANRANPIYELEIEALRGSALKSKPPSIIATSLVWKLIDWLDEKPKTVVTINDPDDHPPPLPVPSVPTRRVHPHSPKRGHHPHSPKRVR